MFYARVDQVFRSDTWSDSVFRRRETLAARASSAVIEPLLALVGFSYWSVETEKTKAL
jgi:hypothetical protein